MVDAFKTWAAGRQKIRVYYLYNADPQAVDAFKREVAASGLPVEVRATSEVGGGHLHPYRAGRVRVLRL